MVKELIDGGGDLGINQLMYALKNGHTEIAEFLIEKGVITYEHTIRYVFKTDNPECIQKLFEGYQKENNK